MAGLLPFHVAGAAGLRWALAVCGVAVSALTTPAPAFADRALVIGINAYNDPFIPPLAGAVHDARAMARFLETHLHYEPGEIRVMTDAEATRDAVVAAIEEWLIAGSSPGDRIFLYFAGHGTQVQSLADADSKDQVIVTIDSHFDDRRSLRSFLRDKELSRLLGRLDGRQVTVVVDACHSGTITRQLTPPADAQVRARGVPYVAPLDPIPSSSRAPGTTRSSGLPESAETLLESRPGLTLWTAVTSNQLAFEDHSENPPAGVFTSHFIKGLAEGAADTNGDGRITHAEFHTWLTDASGMHCLKLGQDICRFGMTPTLEVSRSLLPQPVAVTLEGADPLEGLGPTEVAEATLQPTAAPTGAVSGPASTGAGRVELSILPEGPYRLGQTVRFRVETDFDGHVVLLNIDAEDHLVQLFPNQHSERSGKGDRIFAQRPLTLADATYGFEFTVQEPLGNGRLIAVVTADPVDFSAIAAPARSLVPMPAGKATDYLIAIAELLQQPWTGDATDRPVRHAIAELSYRTER